MLEITVMLINYFHDLSVALLASNIIVIFLLGKYLDAHPAKAEMMASVFTRLSHVTYWALAFVLLGGAFRAYFYMDFEWNPAVGRGQIAALVAKHILLVGFTIFGIIMHLRYVRKYGSSESHGAYTKA
ncbi:MAG TPA: hypothetical protein VLB27_01255 [candidate division Zixibacteria bacterium]|nr:hypothetical protein [candidate division Zixibacteria bacterium]